MEQNLNDKPLSNMQIARYIESLRKEMNFDDEVYGLVKSDLEDGLTQEQTEKYLDKNFNIGQMRVLSEGLHKGIPEELFNILHNNKLSGNQMKVSLEFYEKGVPVETIQEAVARGEKPVVMRRLYEEVLAQLSKAAEQYTQDSEYVKELIAQMEMVVEKINYQEERYDALNKKLSDVEVLKEDKEVTERLVKENEDKDGIISHQQDELNKASSTIARLRDSIEHKDKEMERMRDRIESLEDKIMSAASDDQKVAEKEEKAGPSEVLAATDNKETVKTLADSQAVPPMYNGIPVYYQIPVTDSAGRVIQHLPVERTERKSNGGIAALFARLSFKKKSRADIVKLVASGDLVPAQLVQIKSAIEKGLTEGQLAIDSAQADVIKELGFGESLVMLILTALLAIIIIICGFFIIYTVYFRFLKILIIVPLGAIACSTMAGNRMVSHTMSTYCKYFLSCVFEAVTMALAIVVCNAFINAGLPSFTGSYADWAQTLIYLCEMTFTIAMTVGSVKGAQTLTSKAFGL